MMRPLTQQISALVLSLALLVACNSQTADVAPAPTETVAAEEPSPTVTKTEPSATDILTATPIPPSPTPEPSSSPSPTPPEYTIIEDVPYASAVGPEARDQLLDIYLPGEPAGYPPVIWAHGNNLDKSSGATLARILARNGFIVLSINWRDQFDDRDWAQFLREALENANCALQFAAAQAEQHGGDPERVIWSGFSAGGWLGSLISFSAGDLAAAWDEYAAVFDGPPQQVNCVEESPPPQVSDLVVSSTPFEADFWFGADENASEDPEISALRTLIAIGNNPELRVRIIHGNADRPEIVEGAELFTTALEEAGYDVARFPQAGPHSPYLEQVLEQIQALVDE